MRSLRSHIHPWLVAYQTLFPRRLHLSGDSNKERNMNILGLQITVARPSSRKVPLAVVIGAASLAVMAGGTAYAYWTTTGTGSGTAQARVFTAPTVAAGTAPAGQLYPGLTADGSAVGGDLVLSVSNSNPFPVTITGVSAGTGTITASGALVVGAETQPQADAACQASSGVSIITKPSPSVTYGTGTSIPAGATNFAVTVSKVVSMSTASVNECQGATFTLPSTGVSLTYSSN